MKGSESSGGSHRVKKLGDAKGDEATQERCKAILETIAPGRVKYWPSGRDYYIELPRGGGAWWVYLRRWSEGRIAIYIYPGNTVRQARKFFESTRKQEFLGLNRKGWKIRPYLCFGFIAWGRLAHGNKLSPEQYFDYWASEEIRQIRREDNGFEDLSQRLRARRLIDAKGQREIEEDFIKTKRDFMNVCPGFELIYAWRRAEANRLDRDQRFVDAVRARTDEALRGRHKIKFTSIGSCSMFAL
ncbi:MAG: hypothetical protein LAP13_13000 [Acidobacteriia bacterium]|nr:hypothetical protein [Terriglobia bacterium]